MLPGILFTGLLLCLLLLLLGVLFIPVRVHLQVVKEKGSLFFLPAVSARISWLGITFYRYRWPPREGPPFLHNEERRRYYGKRKHPGLLLGSRFNLEKVLQSLLVRAEIRYFYGYLRFGLVDAALTAWTGGLLWSVISMLLVWSQKKLRWKAQPVIEIYPDFCLSRVDFDVRLEADFSFSLWELLRSNKRVIK